MSHRTIAAIMGILGGALVLFWVGSFGVNVPIADDWDHVKTSMRWHDGGLDAASLVAPHNEHCLAIPRLINHAVLKASGGNYRAVLFVNAAIAIATLGILLGFVRRWALPPTAFAVFAAAVALLLTSWCQWQNWVWAFQTPWFLLPLVLVAAAVAVARASSPWTAVSAAALAAWVGPFCMANGLFVGWALLPSLALRLAEEPRQRAWRAGGVAIGCIVAATAVGVAIVARARGPSAGGLAVALGSPLEAVRLGLAVLGSPLDPHGAFYGRKLISTIAGAASLALGFAAVVAGARMARKQSAKELGPGFALMVYGIASVAAVVVGRLSMLAADPVESRYHTFAIAWHVGVLMSCGWLAAMQARGWRIALAVASIACIAATLLGMKLFYRHGENMRRSLEEHQAIYRAAKEPAGREKLQGIARHYGPDGILERLDGMARAGMLHPDYAPAAPKAPATPKK